MLHSSGNWVSRARRLAGLIAMVIGGSLLAQPVMASPGWSLTSPTSTPVRHAQSGADLTAQRLDDEELDRQLLGDAPQQNDQMKAVSDNMGRSQRRLGDLHDPGQTTQDIQQRIIAGLDLLIEESRRSATPPLPSASPQRPADPTGDAQPENHGASAAANAAGSNSAPTDRLSPGEKDPLPADVRVRGLSDWTRISPRLHGPVMESRGEHSLECHKRLVDDYYRALATPASDTATQKK